MKFLSALFTYTLVTSFCFAQFGGGSLPPNPVVNVSPTSICGSGNATFSIAGKSCGSGMAFDRHYRWYSSPGSTTPIHEGHCYTVNNISSNYTVYVETHDLFDDTKSARVSKTVVVNSSSAAPGASGGAVCGSGAITLHVNSPSGTYRWYNSSNQVVTTNLAAGIIVGSNGHTLQVDRSTTTYYRVAKVVNGCVGNKSSNVYATVNSTPGQASGSNRSRCGTGTVTLTASVGSNGNQVRWYAASNGGSLLHTGTSYTTPGLSSSRTYYAETYNTSTGCRSSRKAITATINPVPGSPTTSDVTRCSAGTTELVVDGYSANQFAPFNWYTANAGGTLIQGGLSSMSANVDRDTSFFVSRYNETSLCESTRTQVNIFVNTPSITTRTMESHCATVTSVPLTGEPSHAGSWSINGPSSAIVLDNHLDMTELTPGQTYTLTYTYAVNSCSNNQFKKDFYVTPVTVSGEITGNTTACGSGTGNFHLNNQTGPVQKWEYRYQDGSGEWTDYELITDADVTSVNPLLSQWSEGIRNYEIRVTVQNGSCSLQTTSHQIKVYPAAVGGTISGGQSTAGIAKGTLTLENYTGSITGWQVRTTGAWIDLPNSNGSVHRLFENITQTTEYRAIVKSVGCAVADTSAIGTVQVLAGSSLDLGLNPNLRPGQNTVITAASGHTNYQWFKDGVATQNGSSNQLTVTKPGAYRVTVTPSSEAVYTTGDAIIGSQFIPGENAVISYTYQAPYTTLDLFSISPDSVIVGANVFDGLGRNVQKVGINASSNKLDVVTPMEYDSLGREIRDYLPYEESQQSSLYKSNALVTNDYTHSAHYDYYMNRSVHHSPYGWAERRFEDSPLNRIVQHGAPGQAWQINGNNSSRFSYDVVDSGKVIHFDNDSIFDDTIAYYGAGMLTKNTSIDEDSLVTVEYVDRSGKTVMRMLKTGDPIKPWAKTYYVYDDRSRLSVVLPPEASDSTRLTNEFFNASNETAKRAYLNTWAYLYDYDHRNRMIMKKVPGADSVFMVYDQWDRLVLTQDGNQRKSNQWLFTKYDVLNRPIMTGLATIPGTIQQVRNSVQASAHRSEAFDAAGINQYTNLAYPVDALVDEYLTITYYDNYDFQSHADWNALGLGFSNPTGLAQNLGVKGQVTGILTKRGDSGWIKSVTYYGNKYRIIQTQSTNHLGGKDVVTNYPDFIGQIDKTITEHSNVSDTTTITRRFIYDHVGRLIDTYHQVNDETEVLLSHNEYNELGELIEKDLHEGTGGTFAQSLDYAYNIRGWLTKINQPDLSGTSDLFGMELHYNTNPLNTGNTNFNGNISAMQWSDITGSVANTSRGYNYDYDGLNRLKTASHFVNGVSNTNNPFDVSIGNYDLNGNIINLTRNDATGSAMDDLSYGYEGNRLKYVADASGDSLGFYNGYTADTVLNPDYAYDWNGNMVKDRNKEIDSIYYNHLNLLVKVVFQRTGDSIRYLYDAAGIKLQQAVYNGGKLMKTTDYVGVFIYETDSTGSRKLQLIQHEEGRFIPIRDANGNITSFDAQYHLKDHLGNVRVTFSTTPENYEMDATMEYSEEAANFNNYQATSDAAAAHSGTHVFRNSNTVNDGLGMNTFLSVNKRDTVKMSAYAYYNDAGGNYNLAAGLIEGALFGVYGGNYGVEGTTVNQSNFNDAFASGTALGGRSGSSDAPRAYINYIFFNTEMEYLRAGFKQIGTESNGTSTQVVADDFIADQEGYLLVYLSNETQGTEVVVSWDDLNVYHGKTNVVSTQDYCPFGGTFNNYRRSYSTAQNYLFNGNEWQPELGWYDFNARFYDPWGGPGFLQIDPMAEEREWLSPYNFAQMNPMNRIDPTGLLDDIYYRDGEEVMRIVNDKPDRYFEQRENENYASGYETVQIQNPKRNPSVLQSENETGYIYSDRDVEVRTSLLSLGSGNIITAALLKQEAEGNFQPVSGQEYRDQYVRRWGTDKAFWMGIEEGYFNLPGAGGANGGSFSRASLAGYQKGLAKFSKELSNIKRPDGGFSADFKTNLRNSTLPKNQWNRFQRVNRGRFSNSSEASKEYNRIMTGNVN